MSLLRKQLSGPEKLAILKRPQDQKTPISDLCDEHGQQPSQIYYWQSQLFDHGAGIFERKPGRQGKLAESAKDRKIAQLEALVAQKEAKLAQTNEEISELMEEN